MVRPKWEFSQALRVFQSEFKAKSINFHYAMDVSYDDQGVDHVIADLNRMKQGNKLDLSLKIFTDLVSAGKPDHERHQVHI